MGTISRDSVGVLASRCCSGCKVLLRKQSPRRFEERMRRRTEVRVKFRHFLRRGGCRTIIARFKRLKKLGRLPKLTVRELVKGNCKFTTRNS